MIVASELDPPPTWSRILAPQLMLPPLLTEISAWKINQPPTWRCFLAPKLMLPPLLNEISAWNINQPPTWRRFLAPHLVSPPLLTITSAWSFNQAGVASCRNASSYQILHLQSMLDQTNARCLLQHHLMLHNHMDNDCLIPNLHTFLHTSPSNCCYINKSLIACYISTL